MVHHLFFSFIHHYIAKLGDSEQPCKSKLALTNLTLFYFINVLLELIVNNLAIISNFAMAKKFTITKFHFIKKELLFDCMNNNLAFPKFLKSYVVPVKSKVKSSQKNLVFSEYMNFRTKIMLNYHFSSKSHFSFHS